MTTATLPTRRRIKPARVVNTVVALLVSLAWVFPVYWMLNSSLDAQAGHTNSFWPAEPTLASYRKLLDPATSIGQDFLRFFWNRRILNILLWCHFILCWKVWFIPGGFKGLIFRVV